MITDNYIKMCEQAEELQRLLNEPRSAKEWKHSYYVEKWEKRNYNDIEYIDFCGENLLGRKIIWLPTLEQLFEMVKKVDFFWQLTHRKYEGKKVYILTYFRYYHKTEFIDVDKKIVFIKMIMKEKYNKAWAGEKWEVMK